MATIAIIAHRLDPFRQAAYIIRSVAQIWQEQGHSVMLVRDPAQLPPADIAVLHVDLTITPLEYAAVTTHYPRVINGRVLDISKRHISRYLVAARDGYNGPVIVKTDANSAASGEFIHALKIKTDDPQMRARIAAFNYQIFATPAEVPAEIWADSAFVVERFVPEQRGTEFCLRTWTFFGNRFTHSLVLSDSPVVKGRNVKSWEPLGDVPEDLQLRRHELGFDYGKFDYVMHDGRAVLYDANRTPTLPYAAAQYKPRAERLAGGLDDLLR